ncbi:MAG: MerR family transcriptional regulator [Nannocystaceae bacterium]
MNDATHRIGEVAEIAGVTVRTLHHYDAIALLRPSGRSARGYRLYSTDDLLRLQQIQIGRALGLSLEAIRKMLDEPDFDRRAALERQRAALTAQLADTRAMLAAIDAAIALIDRPKDPSTQGETTMQTTNEQLKELFDGFDPEAHKDEAQARWGQSEAFRESARRTKSYTPDDWAALKAEAEAIEGGLAAAMNGGEASDSARARELAEAHRLHIDRWFYPCGYAMHRSLAQMYVGDPRFAAHYDRRAEGLAAYVSAAIEANAAAR